MHDSMTINLFDFGMIGPSANCHSLIYQFPICFTFWWYHKTCTVFWMYWFVDDLRSLWTTLSFDILKSTSEAAKRWQNWKDGRAIFSLESFQMFLARPGGIKLFFSFFFRSRHCDPFSCTLNILLNRELKHQISKSLLIWRLLSKQQKYLVWWLIRVANSKPTEGASSNTNGTWCCNTNRRHTVGSTTGWWVYFLFFVSKGVGWMDVQFIFQRGSVRTQAFLCSDRCFKNIFGYTYNHGIYIWSISFVRNCDWQMKLHLCAIKDLLVTKGFTSPLGKQTWQTLEITELRDAENHIRHPMMFTKSPIPGLHHWLIEV